ncbi:MAG: hypothetical protein RL217_1627 [Pseudomonadota bacterium]|jgi:hypothetical protein
MVASLGNLLMLTLLVGAGLLLFLWWARRLQSRFARQDQAKALIKEAQQVLDALDFLIDFDNSAAMQRALLDYVELLQSHAKKLNPTASTGLVYDAQDWLRRISERKVRVQALRSDKELHRARRLIDLTLKALNKMTKHQLIEGDALLTYRRALRMTLLEKEVAAYRDQGDEAIKRGDINRAANFYKMAKKILQESDLVFPDKNAQIRALSTRATELSNGYLKEHLEKLLNKAPPERKMEHGIPVSPLAEKRKF